MKQRSVMSVVATVAAVIPAYVAASTRAAPALHSE